MQLSNVIAYKGVMTSFYLTDMTFMLVQTLHTFAVLLIWLSVNHFLPIRHAWSVPDLLTKWCFQPSLVQTLFYT